MSSGSSRPSALWLPWNSGHCDCPSKSCCLISVLRPFDPEPRFEEAAHSVDLELSPNQVLYLSGVDVQCQQQADSPAGLSTIHSGQHQFGPDGPIHAFHGLGLHVRVPCVHDAAMPSRPVLGDANDGEEISFMARRFVRPFGPARSSSSSTSSSSSSSGVVPDWRQTVVVVCDGPTMPVQLPWHDQRALVAHLSEALRDPVGAILRLQHVSHRPPDLIQADLACILVQKASDFRPSPYHRLVLVDIDVTVETDLPITPFQRRACWVPLTLSCRALFRSLGLESLHRFDDDHQQLWHNNAQVAHSATVLLTLDDGDYLRIFVGPVPDPSSCSSAPLSDFDEPSATNISDEEMDVTSMLQAPDAVLLPPLLCRAPDVPTSKMPSSSTASCELSFGSSDVDPPSAKAVCISAGA